MFNYSGIIYRIWGVCGIILLIGVICLLIRKPKGDKFKIKHYKVELFTIVFAIVLGLIYISRIIFPSVSSYTGEFIEKHRNSRVAPPLPFTSEYVFLNANGKNPKFYLDSFSKKNIYPFDFEEGKQYTIYFDEFTKVIVRVEIVD